MSDHPAPPRLPPQPDSIEALRASEQAYRTLVEMSHDLIWSVDAQGRWTFVNSAARTIYGYEPAEMLGRPFMDFETPEQAEKDLEVFARIKSGTPAFNYETVHLRKDGRPVHLSFNAVFLRDKNGIVLGTTGTAQDITERTRAEAALLASERELRLITNHLPALVSRVDRNLRYLFANDQYKWIMGKSREEIVGRTMSEVLGSEVFGRAEPHVRKVLAGDLVSFENQIQGPGEELKTMLVNYVPDRNDENIVAGFFIVAHDITARKQAEDALRERERELRQITNNVPGPVSRVGRDLRYRFVNDHYERVFGKPRTEVVGHTMQEVLGAKLFEQIEPQIHRVLSGERVTLETHTEMPTGDLTHWFVTFEPDSDREKNVEGFYVVALDITERKRADDALRHSEAEARQRLREIEQIYAYSPIGLFIFDREYRFVRINERMAEINGFSVAHHIGKSLEEIVPELAAFLKETYRPVFERGESVLNVEIHGKTPKDPDNERDWIGNYFPLKSETGEVIGLMGAVLEITERKKAEAALLESDRRLTTLISNLPGYVYRVANDSDYTPEFISAGVESITGYSPREYLADRTISCGSEIHPDDRDEVWATVQRAVAAREPYECEYRIRTKSGKTKWVWERGSGNYASTDELTALEGFVTDITERKQLEEQLRQVQKLEAVGQLAGGVAHDFNNLLTVIQGHLTLLENHDEEPEVTRESLDEIKQAADRAANLTRQLLTFSRRQAIRPCHFDLNDIVTNMARMLQRILGEDISIELRLSPDQLGLLADTGMIEQVLLNIAVNSRDAMPRGGRLSIETTAVDFDDSSAARMPSASPGAFVCLSTTDTGKGIAPDVLPRIFEPFFTTKETGKGTGLGLATVYGIVQQHEGWIDVDSAPGQGTTFHIYLPRKSGAVTAAPPRSESPARGGQETILLVEDEPALRSLVTNLLGRAGYHVYTAATGPLALEMWREHADEIRLLVTDLVMPDGLSGFDLGRQLASEAPALRVIYTSGYSPEIAGHGAELIAGVNFLSKPFEIDDLLRAIRAALDEAQSGSEKST